MLKTIYLNTAVYFYKLNYNFINITNYTEINVKIEKEDVKLLFTVNMTLYL